MNLLFGQGLNKSNYLSFLISLIPISFIAGNMIININIILIIISSLILFKKKIFQLKYYFFDLLIFAYFSLILFTGLLNDYSLYVNGVEWMGSLPTTTRSILFFKYLLLYLVLRYLVENQIISLKLFFISCLISTLFVSFDIFFQSTFGKDVFGYEIIGSGRKLGGPFGDELIAGGFIQRFSIFSFFLFPIFYYKKFENYLKYLLPALFIIFFFGIAMAGNRMPLILFIFTIFLIFLFDNKLRKYLISFIGVFCLITFLMFNSNDKIRDNFLNFKHQIVKISNHIIDQNSINEKSPAYLKEFSTFYETWKMHKYLGGGIKSFRYYCHERPNINKEIKFICNMHPHNYYLEILTETGVVGLFLILTIFTCLLYLSLYKKYFSSSPINKNNMIIPFIFLFISEVFPFKSTGSFFTTGNTTYLIMLIAITIGLTRSKNFIEN